MRWLSKDTLPESLSQEMNALETYCIDSGLSSRREIKQDFLRLYQHNKGFIKFSDGLELVKMRYTDKINARLGKKEYSDDSLFALLSLARKFDRIIYWLRTGYMPENINILAPFFTRKTTMTDAHGVAGLHQSIATLFIGDFDKDELYPIENKLANLDDDCISKLSEIQEILNKFKTDVNIFEDYAQAIPYGKTCMFANALGNALGKHFAKWDIAISNSAQPLRNPLALCKLSLEKKLKGIG